MAIESCDFRLIAQLANDYLERHRRGEKPHVDEYVAQHPHLEVQIRETFPMMLLMEDHAPEATDTTGDRDTKVQLPKIERLGDFRILREIGRGGMGVVYTAIQESLGRHVALKVFPTNTHMHPRHQERFRRESRSAAMLHHTNIVPVFAVGEEDGVLYYAMQFISGAGLDEVIQELGRLRRSDKTKPAVVTEFPTQRAATDVAQTLLSNVDPSVRSAPILQVQSPNSASGDNELRSSESGYRENTDSSLIGSAVHLPGQQDDRTLSESGSLYWHSVARIGVQVAEALDYAHGQGTLHRDIKPSNLLLDQNATIWVTDFGLAKSVEQDDLTHTGELVGTLRYMSPEQFSGKADQRSDLYSLGLTLYELLVLRPAFNEPDRNRLVRAIASQEPPRPRKIDGRIPRDLETIVLKAIEREPGSRYQAARDLARDLTRFLNHEPIQARPITATERVVKWVKRHPTVAGLSGALILLFLASFALVT